MTHDPLTDSEIVALADYAAKHGRTWKSKLNAAWMSGGNEEGTGGILRSLRNSHGPSWLARYKLPSAHAVAFARRGINMIASRPGDAAAIYAEEAGVDYATALVRCNMD